MRYRSRGCRGRARAVAGAVPLCEEEVPFVDVQFGSSYSCFAPSAATNLAERRLRGAHGGEGPARAPKTDGRAALRGQAPAVRARRGLGEVHEKGGFDGETAGLPVGLAARGAELPRDGRHSRARPAAARHGPRNSPMSRIFC